MNEDLPIYDEQLSLQLAGGNADLAAQMLSMFLRDLPELRQLANSAYQTGDTESLFQHVHKVNGSTRYCAAPAIGKAANTLELLLKQEQSDIDEALTALNTEIDRLLTLKKLG